MLDFEICHNCRGDLEVAKRANLCAMNNLLYKHNVIKIVILKKGT